MNAGMLLMLRYERTADAPWLPLGIVAGCGSTAAPQVQNAGQRALEPAYQSYATYIRCTG